MKPASVFLDKAKFADFWWKMLMSAELKGVSRISYICWIFLSSISLSSMCMLIWSSLCFVNHHRILNSWAQLWHSCIYFCCTGLKHICSVLLAESRQVQFLFQLEASLQTHHVDSTLKRRGNDRFHVVSTWNPRGVFVGMVDLSDFSLHFSPNHIHMDSVRVDYLLHSFPTWSQHGVIA